MTRNREEKTRHLYARRSALDRQIMAAREEMDEITRLINDIETGRTQNPQGMVLLVLHTANDSVASVHTFPTQEVRKLDNIGLQGYRLVDCGDSMILHQRHVYEDRYVKMLAVGVNFGPTKQGRVTLGYFAGKSACDHANAWATIYRAQAMKSS